MWEMKNMYKELINNKIHNKIDEKFYYENIIEFIKNDNLIKDDGIDIITDISINEKSGRTTIKNKPKPKVKPKPKSKKAKPKPAEKVIIKFASVGSRRLDL